LAAKDAAAMEDGLFIIFGSDHQYKKMWIKFDSQCFASIEGIA